MSFERAIAELESIVKRLDALRSSMDGRLEGRKCVHIFDDFIRLHEGPASGFAVAS
jgi:hypothetical protein